MGGRIHTGDVFRRPCRGASAAKPEPADERPDRFPASVRQRARYRLDCRAGARRPGAWRGFRIGERTGHRARDSGACRIDPAPARTFLEQRAPFKAVRDCGAGLAALPARGSGAPAEISGITPMCGILGVVAKTPVNQLLYDGLLLLQHRGQDAAGIVTSEHKAFHMHKGPGMVRDVFRTRNMRSLSGGTGIGHCRYPTAGSAFNAGEAQPFYVNSTFGIVLGHNGNLTNSEALKQEMFRQDLRHINTNSVSEVLLNVLAHELELAAKGQKLDH